MLRAGYLVVTGVTAVVVAGVGLWVRRTRSGPAADAFAALAFACAGWATMVTLQLVGPRALRPRLFELSRVVAWSVPPLWLVFATRYAGRSDLLTRRRLGVIAGLYLAAAGLAVTNPLHGLLFHSWDLAAPLGFADPVRTPLFYVQFVLIYLHVGAGLTVILRRLVTARGGGRAQLGLVLLAAAPNVAVNATKFAGLLPLPTFEYTAVTTSLFAAVIAVALFRYDLFSVDPLGRDTVLEAAEEGFVAVDRRGRVVDYNDAAADALSGLEGSFGDDLVDRVPSLFAQADGGTTTGSGVEDDGRSTPPAGTAGEGSDPTRAGSAPGAAGGEDVAATAAGADAFDPSAVADEVTVFDGDTRRQLGVNVTPVRRGEQVRGHVLVLRDLTDVETYARRLEQQTRQLDRFAATVSHDLRNPLAVARANAEHLRAEGAAADRVDEITDSLDRMDALIEDALTLAREGQAIEERELVSLERVTRDAWRMVGGSDGAVLDLELDGETVYADRDRLQRALENLLRNAVDHAGETVTVTVGADEDGFFVADDGPGVPADERNQVFEQGFTTREDGTGLGLPIVATIAEAHGWSVDLAAESPGGARFVVTGVEFGPQANEGTGSATGA